MIIPYLRFDMPRMEWLERVSPAQTTMTIIGVWAIIFGIVSVFMALRDKRLRGVLLGLTGVLFGVVCIVSAIMYRNL